MKTKRIHVTLLTALLAAASTASATSPHFEYRVYSHGTVQATDSAPPDTPGAPSEPSKPVEVPAAKFVVSGSPGTAQDFGQVAFGASAPQAIAITVENQGDAAGSLPAPVFGGSAPGDFAQTNNCASVSAGQDCTVTVDFHPTAPGLRSANLTVADEDFVFSGTGQLVTSYQKLTSGSSYRIPIGVASITVWAIGAGGGGAGSGAPSTFSGGGGGAGGLVTYTFTVAPGGTLAYGLGQPGMGGDGGAAGSVGGATSLNYGAISLTALGGSGGIYNSYTAALGGSGSGVGSIVDGGTGGGASTNTGGGGGGAISGVSGNFAGVPGPLQAYGAPGGQAQYTVPLQTALSALGFTLTSKGSGCSTGPVGACNGFAGTGFGTGGGGASSTGGNGGNGLWGGGGGGAAVGGGAHVGGSGGAGVIILKLN